ncbi:H-NS family nucleoid-associated regulatory protein [Candidatus Vallotia tarda]|uniref:H-NS-like proteins n=1 Tax=Candidatus Vallotiella hemipterorum TaxID=1177213 RepID=A0A8E4GIF1_9BURK|nr:H-NS family nucleoid-associated regulatory protein [Candidatus Vallotia tarda]CAD6506650.1 H-NS-like proteins [Candidatus Vallotia tarda]CAG7605164.1 H-NS-like proteins [Candidatus Vallotia tarda]
MDEQKRQKIIAYIHKQMAEYDISVERLAEALAEKEKDIKPVLFRDAYGNVWDGKGEMPNWLKRAVYAGQSTEHFKVKTK